MNEKDNIKGYLKTFNMLIVKAPKSTLITSFMGDKSIEDDELEHEDEYCPYCGK